MYVTLQRTVGRVLDKLARNSLSVKFIRLDEYSWVVLPLQQTHIGGHCALVGLLGSGPGLLSIFDNSLTSTKRPSQRFSLILSWNERENDGRWWRVSTIFNGVFHFRLKSSQAEVESGGNTSWRPPSSQLRLYIVRAAALLPLTNTRHCIIYLSTNLSDFDT